MTAYAALVVAFLVVAYIGSLAVIVSFIHGASKGRDWADEQARRVRR